MAAEPPRHGRHVPDAYEIGYTWRTRSAVRTAANIEANCSCPHAFEAWQVIRVCFHTDARNGAHALRSGGNNRPGNGSSGSLLRRC